MGLVGVTMLSVSVLVQRTHVLARWIGTLGCGCGLITLAAVVAGFGAFATPLAILWGLGLAVAMLRSGPTD